MPAQLALPLDAAAPKARAHGLRAAHVYPMVGERIGPGKTFWSGRVPASRAWTYPYIVLDDAGATWTTITLDCVDRPAMAAGLCDLPPPNWMVFTERGAHLTWCLARPVAKHQRARRAPETYLARTAEYFTHAVSADPGFGGLSRNPAHPDAHTYWAARKPYDLDTLSSVIPFNWKRPPGLQHVDRPQRRFVRHWPAMGRQAGERGPAGAVRPACCERGDRRRA